MKADNIHYVSIKEGEVAERLLTVLKGVRVSARANPSRDRPVTLIGDGLCHLSIQGLGALVNEREKANVRKLLSLNPRKVGLYKPLFGAAFHDIIGTISHDW